MYCSLSMTLAPVASVEVMGSWMTTLVEASYVTSSDPTSWNASASKNTTPTVCRTSQR